MTGIYTRYMTFGIYLSFTWYIPGIYHAIVLEVYTGYIPGIYLSIEIVRSARQQRSN
jgi:hypothetical protein